MPDLGYTDNKYVSSAHLKRKFNWASRIFTYQIWGKEEMVGGYWEVSNGAPITEALNDLDLSKNMMSSWNLCSAMKQRLYPL